MGVLDAFLSTWSQARATFGDGTPAGGDAVDQSAQLRGMRDRVQSAAPRDWTGAASDAYADASRRHSQALGAMADLDQRLKAEVDRSAAVVSAGRRDLDAVRQWVVDAAASVPRTTAGERVLWPLVSKGAGELADIIKRSNDDLAFIAGRIRTLGAEYNQLEEPHEEGEHEASELPETTLDLADIVYKSPGEAGDPGMMELVPGSGVWVPDPASRFYMRTPVRAPLDLNDIQYFGRGVKGNPWQMELVPNSGAWVPNPNYPGYQPRTPEAPVDLAEIVIVDPGPLIPAGMVELWPRSGVLIPDPYLGRPF